MISRMWLWLALCMPAASLAAEGPPRLGFMSNPVGGAKAASLGIAEGMKITYLVEGCPAYTHLQKGDIIYEMEGTPVKTMNDARKTYAAHLLERKVKLKVLRGTERLEMELGLFECQEHQGEAGTGMTSALGGGGGGGLPFASPVQLDGSLAEWGNPGVAQALVADLAGQAGGQLAGMAASQAASKIPLAGGLLGGAAKQAAQAAVEAALSAKFPSDQRFATACELGQHLQTLSGRPDFASVMLAVNAVHAEHLPMISACMGAGAAAPAAVAPAAVLAPSAAAGAPDLAAQLEKLAGLHAAGALSEAEYKAAKAKLLGL